MSLGNASDTFAPNPSGTPSYGLKTGVLSASEVLAQSIALIAPTAAPVMTIPLVYGLAGQGVAIVT